MYQSKKRLAEDHESQNVEKSNFVDLLIEEKRKER